MRRKIVAGNWKMNNDEKESHELINSIIEKNSNNKNCEIYISPSFPFLKDAKELCNNTNINIMAQNVSHISSGALTGDVSFKMLKSIGVSSVIIGHSERRTIFNESDSLLLTKLEICIKNDFEVFFCIGEDIEARNSGNEYKIIEDQLNKTIFKLENLNPEQLVIAYEPVWAIGTGLSASPNQAQGMHKFIREKLVNNFSDSFALKIPILYGGSVKPGSANDIFANNDVDGGLIGGASLKSQDFSDIINSI
tara:strand:+ start:55 stop:807 length:753 start_codon:yes stop_codon:yes gene_type:complete